MIKKIIIILVSILLILIFILSPLVGAQTPPETTLTIEGQLVNATSGEPGKAGIPLMLHTYDGRQMSGMIDGVTGSGGTFQFEEVEVVEGRIFEVMATVGRTTYFSERTTVASEQTTLELPVKIYDATTDAGAIRIKQMHTLVDFFNPVLLQISEIYIISNDGNQTVEGSVTLDDGQTAALRFTLPQGATDLTFEGGQLDQRFLATDNGFADTFGVRPGPQTSQFMVKYYLPYQDGMNINRSLFYPVDKSSVVIPQLGVSLAGDDFTSADSGQLQDGRAVDIFTVEDTPAGQPFTLQLKGQPEMNGVSVTPEFSAQQPADPPATTDQTQVFVGLGLVVLGVVLLGGAIWWWHRWTADSASATDTETPEADLIWVIAELDEAYQAGGVSEEDYIRRRGVLRAEWQDLSAEYLLESDHTGDDVERIIEETNVGVKEA